MARGLLDMIRARHPPTDEHCAKFERELAHAIATLIERNDPSCYRDVSGFDDGGLCVVMTVDYHPDRLLHAALIEAGVHQSVASTASLPLKSSMRVSARRVLVIHGYGQSWSEIWGPAWGCTLAEQQAVDRYRGEVEKAVWSARDAIGATWMPQEWKGCVPLEATKPPVLAIAPPAHPGEGPPP